MKMGFVLVWTREHFEQIKSPVLLDENTVFPFVLFHIQNEETNEVTIFTQPLETFMRLSGDIYNAVGTAFVRIDEYLKATYAGNTNTSTNE